MHKAITQMLFLSILNLNISLFSISTNDMKQMLKRIVK